MAFRALLLLTVVSVAAVAGESAPPAVETGADSIAKIVPVPFDPARDGQSAADCLAYVELFSESVLDGTFTLAQDPALWDTFDEANRTGTLLEKAMEVIAARVGSESARDLAKDTAARYRAQLSAARQSGDPAQRTALARDLAGQTHACSARAAGWSAAEGWDVDEAPAGDDAGSREGKDLP